MHGWRVVVVFAVMAACVFLSGECARAEDSVLFGSIRHGMSKEEVRTLGVIELPGPGEAAGDTLKRSGVSFAGTVWTLYCVFNDGRVSDVVLHTAKGDSDSFERVKTAIIAEGFTPVGIRGMMRRFDILAEKQANPSGYELALAAFTQELGKDEDVTYFFVDTVSLLATRGAFTLAELFRSAPQSTRKADLQRTGGNFYIRFSFPKRKFN